MRIRYCTWVITRLTEYWKTRWKDHRSCQIYYFCEADCVRFSVTYCLHSSPPPHPPTPHSLTLHKNIVTCSPQCNPSFRCSFNQSWPWAWAIQIAFKSVRFSPAICLWPQRWCANVLYVVCVHERSQLLIHKLRTIFWGDCHRQTMLFFFCAISVTR